MQSLPKLEIHLANFDINFPPFFFHTVSLLYYSFKRAPRKRLIFPSFFSSIGTILNLKNISMNYLIFSMAKNQIYILIFTLT